MSGAPCLPGGASWLGPCPPTLPSSRLLTARLSTSILAHHDELLLAAKGGACLPRAIRLRGGDEDVLLSQVDLVDDDELTKPPVELLIRQVPIAVFADRDGLPELPRTMDGPEDTSDGPPVDWPVFGGVNCLRLTLRSEREFRLQMLLTFLAVSDPYPSPTYNIPVAPDIRVQFVTLAHCTSKGFRCWNTAQVVDYYTRQGVKP